MAAAAAAAAASVVAAGCTVSRPDTQTFSPTVMAPAVTSPSTTARPRRTTRSAMTFPWTHTCIQSTSSAVKTLLGPCVLEVLRVHVQSAEKAGVVKATNLHPAFAHHLRQRAHISLHKAPRADVQHPRRHQNTRKPSVYTQQGLEGYLPRGGGVGEVDTRKSRQPLSSRVLVNPPTHTHMSKK